MGQCMAFFTMKLDTAGKEVEKSAEEGGEEGDYSRAERNPPEHSHADGNDVMFSQIMLQSVLDPDSNSDFSDTTSIPELVLSDGSVVSDDLTLGPSNSPITVLTQWFDVEEVD